MSVTSGSHAIETLAIHAGQPADPTHGAVMQPIVLASTFAQPEPAKPLRFDYSRSGNPTRAALEQCLAALEGGSTGFAFASGCAAATTLLHTLRPGDHVVSGDDVYGGTFRIFDKVMGPLGIAASFVDLRQPERLQAALTPRTRLVWLETPTNPLLRLVDLRAIADVCQGRGITLAVDNTFASPVLQRPLELGATVVVHSTTKYINGHSDVVGGALITSDTALAERLKFLQNAIGAVPSPMDCYLVLRGIKTLPLRMRQHVAAATDLARRLQGAKGVRRVHYPGLASHAQHELCLRQMSGGGGIITVELDGGLEQARRFLTGLRIFTLAESLGGVESLAEHPGLMTHASIPANRRAELGITDGLVRLSVGLENVEDLWSDLQGALAAARGGVVSARPGVLALIGNTPLVALRSFDTGPCELFVKLENQNPGGSIKDRIGLSMIEAAEESGAIKPGATLVEATAGNTGLGLALVAALKGYHLLLVIPDKMSLEKVVHLRALGVEVRMTRSDVGKGHPEYYQDMAQRIAGELGGYFVNQFGNPANPRAHETTTGPEIWRQMDNRMDAMVCGVGSGGTITGLGRFFARHAPNVEMVLADPAGSVLAEHVRSGKMLEAGSWLVEGIGEDFLPPICDLSPVRHAYTVSDEDSLLTARALLRQEGILAGSSSGTLLAAALRYCREQKTAKRVVTLICDSGSKYLSKMFNDFWMQDHGFLRDRPTGDLRDVIARRPDQGEVVVVSPADTLQTAHARMKISEISQLPVLDGARIVGLLDESDLLRAVTAAPSAFGQPVREFMTTQLVTVSPDAPLDSLFTLFDRGLVAIVCEGEKFIGLITRIDVINHLRRVHG